MKVFQAMEIWAATQIAVQHRIPLDVIDLDQTLVYADLEDGVAYHLIKSTLADGKPIECRVAFNKFDADMLAYELDQIMEADRIKPYGQEDSFVFDPDAPTFMKRAR